MSLALIALPNLCLLAIRMVVSPFNEALSNDLISEMGLHIFALVIGFVVAYRYSFVEDHEYHRSQAINRLSKTYRQEDKGLWDKGEVAIQRLEAKAYSNIRGKGASTVRQRMQSNIGDLNKEADEIEAPVDDHSDYSIHIDGVEQEISMNTEQEESNTTSLRIRGIIERAVNRSAAKRVTAPSKEDHTQPSPQIQTKSIPAESSNWVVPKEIKERNQAKICSDCNIYNNAEANYCSSCGSFLS